MASGEAKYASRRVRLGIAVLREVGDERSYLFYSNAHAVLLRRFSVLFHYN
jgi:hypothetical protein